MKSSLFSLLDFLQVYCKVTDYKFRMEFLYSKLYDKYNKLKKEKESEMEQYSREQELKFMNYVSAAEDMIEHLKSENDRLRAQINDLTDQMASNRSGKEYQYAEYQKLLIEETQKTKVLNEEVERLRNLLPQSQSKSPSRGLQVKSSDLSIGSVGKKRVKPCTRHFEIHTEEAEVMVKETESDLLSIGSVGKKRLKPCTRHFEIHTEEAEVIVKETESDPSKRLSTNDSFESKHQPECCRRNNPSSGNGVNDTGHANCLFQNLLECIVGMKVCTVNQTEGCLSVLHQSSGGMPIMQQNMREMNTKRMKDEFVAVMLNGHSQTLKVRFFFQLDMGKTQPR
ncbi:uncharacterized protein LOC143864763 isoform X2 [Tasmannia lanceolata]|uniref:uncharacterized protein LOC143864763 isoform X2 n=1 Tax=Tasmannia lanceolata TaxID=3420 RepID=UPI004063651C